MSLILNSMLRAPFYNYFLIRNTHTYKQKQKYQKIMNNKKKILQIFFFFNSIPTLEFVYNKI